MAYLLLGVFSEKPLVTGHPLVTDVSRGTCIASSLSVSSALVFPASFSFLAPAFTEWRAFHEAEWALAK